MRCGIFHAVWMLTVVLAVSNAVVTVTCIPIREFDSMLDTLRATGYDLFCNAIVTSDLQFHLLSNDTNSFTFFAPTDASLFALDISQTASSYTETLRFHVVPRRLSLAELRRLPNGYTFPTLLPNRRLHLTRRRSSYSIAVAGVDVAVPGLFYGRHVAVHGLAGSLSLRSENPLSAASLPVPVPSPAGTLYFSPRFGPVSSPENLGPIPFNFGIRRGFHPPAPEIGVVNDASPEPEADWTVGDSPAVTPVVWAPSIPDSAISLSPEGYSDAAAPTPAGLEEGRVTSIESEMEGLRKCENHHDHDVGIELEDYMHCYAT
ncbi:fasciclin-like arabinogalactan protein 19 [Lotus japonicus]|uniref:fasciclin-like arabinogalactan protein 19 n=1 Tax=Lotus japonicus TaxID=34305 RepID=UPI00258299D9|nr:fasciclin-like arabinogalactan protein 19 [Lotus japonicus]